MSMPKEAIRVFARPTSSSSSGARVRDKLDREGKVQKRQFT